MKADRHRRFGDLADEVAARLPDREALVFGASRYTFREIAARIDEAARLLIGERIRRVPVIKQGKMVGLLSRSDVLDFFASTRWTCNVCGRWERGLETPERCFSCSSTDIRLERADPGH